MAEKYKASKMMQKQIKKYLDQFAKENPLFDDKYKDKARGKTLAKCVQYIFNTVAKAKVNGWSSEEIYRMAVHYYDEDQIDIGKAVEMKVMVDEYIYIDDDERAELIKEAKQKVINDEIFRLDQEKKRKREKALAKKKAEEQPQQANTSIPAEIRATVQENYDKEFEEKQKAKKAEEVNPNQIDLF